MSNLVGEKSGGKDTVTFGFDVFVRELMTVGLRGLMDQIGNGKMS